MAYHRAPRSWHRVVTRWLRRATVTAVALTLLGGMTAWGYIVSLDFPPDPAPPQASVLYYRDGRTVLLRVGTTDRTDVPLSAIPLDVRRAFLAAEDRDFENHLGVSARGILRAVWVNLVQGDGQGASTITQQYVRNAYLTQARNLTRKTKEIALALRIERRLGKDEILRRYLNTIYFGRGAYGIQSAAQAYFGTTVDRLTGVQGAVLAALIKDPWLNDPAVDAERAHDRWRWILRAMAEQDWLDPRTAQAATYPTVSERSVTASAVGGPLGLVADRVEAELAALGIAPQVLRTGGLHVVTTIDATAQQAAVRAVATALRGQPKQLRTALVAVDPTDGGVRAYYGGDRGRGYFDDAVAPRPPASTFKPIVLAAGEQRGVAFTSLWNGTSPLAFTDRMGVPLHNKDDVQCPACPLDLAMVHSLNTPFYALAEKVGPARIRTLAVDLGVPQRYGRQRTLVDLKGEPTPGRTRADITLGRYPVAPADLASVYATFAAGGNRVDRHLVASVTGNDGSVWHRHRVQRHRVLDAGVAADVGAVLRAVVLHDGPVPGHDAAAKTGTQQWGDGKGSSDAWTAGFVPQLAAVVWVGRDEPGPIRDAHGKAINGDQMPYRMWRDFLAGALAGQAARPMPPAAFVGDSTRGNARPADPRGGRVYRRDEMPAPAPSAGRASSKPTGRPADAAGRPADDSELSRAQSLDADVRPSGSAAPDDPTPDDPAPDDPAPDDPAPDDPATDDPATDDRAPTGSRRPADDARDDEPLSGDRPPAASRTPSGNGPGKRSSATPGPAAPA